MNADNPYWCRYSNGDGEEDGKVQIRFLLIMHMQHHAFFFHFFFHYFVSSYIYPAIWVMADEP